MSDRTNRKGAAKPPVSAHPAFPAIVALWFAALLGMGSLVLPAAIYERLFEATGIAAMFTSAQAPLGVTARISIALIAALVGVVAGLGVARQVVAANTPRTMSRRAAGLSPIAAAATPAAAKRPISAHEELGAGGLDAEEAASNPQPGRRRALSVTDESARSEFLEFAPLPGQVDAYSAAEPEALELAAYEPEVPVAADSVAEEPVALEDEPLDLAPFGSASLSHAPAAAAPVTETEVPEMDPAQPAPFARSAPLTPMASAEPAAFDAPAGAPALADLVARFARALEGHRAAAVAAADEPLSEPALAPELGEEPEPVDEDAPFAFKPFNSAPPIPHVPAALRPVGYGDEDDGDDDGAHLPDLDLTAALSLGGRMFAAPQPVEAEVAPAEQEPEPEDEGYSSLLAMKSPFGLPRERIEIEIDNGDEDEGDDVEPVVVFPGQAVRRAAPAADGTARDAMFHAATPRPFDAPMLRADALANGAAAPAAQRPRSDNTEQALRDALDKLQKMSGLG